MAKPTTAPELISFKDVNFLAGGIEETICAGEIREIYNKIALLHGWHVEDLLRRESVDKGEQLNCRLLDENARSLHWFIDADGYIQLKLKNYKQIRGVSFTREHDSPPYRPSRRTLKATKSQQLQSQIRRSGRIPAPTTRTNRPVIEPPSPDPLAGCTQPLQVRLHRAAALAASSDQVGVSMNDSLHICGHKLCCVVGHFRPGGEADNRKDVAHHSKYPGTSRLAWPALQ